MWREDSWTRCGRICCGRDSLKKMDKGPSASIQQNFQSTLTSDSISALLYLSSKKVLECRCVCNCYVALSTWDVWLFCVVSEHTNMQF